MYCMHLSSSSINPSTASTASTASTTSIAQDISTRMDPETEERRSAMLLERLSFDQTIRRVFSIYRQGFRTFTTLALVLLVPPIAVASFFIRPKLVEHFQLDEEQYHRDPNYALAHFKETFQVSMLTPVLVIPFSWVLIACVMHGVGTMYLGKVPNAKISLKAGISKICVIVLAMLLGDLVVGLGYLLLVVPGVYMSVRLFVYAPPIIFEKAKAVESLKRSFELTRFNWCYVFCTYMVVVFITFPGQMFWGIFTSRLFGEAIFSSVGCFANYMYMVILYPLVAICDIVMYLNLRVEKEGFNADMLWNEFGRDGGFESEEQDGYRSALLVDEEEGPAVASE